MRKTADFIVKHRVLFFVLFAALIVYAIFGMSKVRIEYSISDYLPDSTDTKQAIEIMDREFVTHGTAKVMIRNISYERAQVYYERIKALDGVQSFTFDDTERYYKSSCALFVITFVGDEGDPRAKAAYGEVVSILDGCDLAVSSSPADDYAGGLAKDMRLILALAAVVILLVLLFTSKSFAEVLVFPVVFVVAALLNMGTNYWFGKISFISNSVCVILQLALAIDYSIILCHRFTEEKEKNPDAAAAMGAALSKAIPEIASSCLTTIAGLMALACMQLKLGADLGFVLTKAIACSILTVFLLMPGLLLFFSKWIDKTKHRSFVPRITGWGKLVMKTRRVFPALFLVAVVAFGVLQNNIPYVYSQNSIDTSRPTAQMTAQKETQAIFGTDNMLAILMPNGDYSAQRALLDSLSEEPLIDSALGIANVKIGDDTYLTDSIGYAKFAELTELAPSTAKAVFYLYAAAQGDYWVALDDHIDTYAVPLLDMAEYAFDLADEGYFTPAEEDKESFEILEKTLRDAKAQLVGESYTRLVFNIAAATEAKETFELIGRIQPSVKAQFPDAIFAGESMSAYDLANSFETDNLIITLLTVAFIYLILMFTFRSWGLPLVLVAVIQGAIFLNFGIVTLVGNNLFFFVYLIVSAIQMGATIDYAILITSRFQELKPSMGRREAAIEALNGAFPTIVTSGSIMTVAALLIGFIVSDPLIASIGMNLGRGTMISVLCVMTVLPQCLCMFSKVLDKTNFKPRPPLLERLRGKRAATVADGVLQEFAAEERDMSETAMLSDGEQPVMNSPPERIPDSNLKTNQSKEARDENAK